MTAVAVWDHAPTADELLAARMRHGWKPTPTETRDMGHANCLVDGTQSGPDA